MAGVGRVDRVTLQMQGDGHGRLYRSEADYTAAKSRRWAWDTLNLRIRNIWGDAPAAVTEDDIRAAAKLLRINLEDRA